MKKILLLILVTILTLSVAGIAVASNIINAEYRTTITATNNSTAATNEAVPFTLSTPEMIDVGMLSANASDAAMISGGGSDTAFMPAANSSYPWITWLSSIGTDSQVMQFLYSKGASGGKIRYFPGDAGMSANDSAPLEPGNNLTIEQQGWIDTSPDGFKSLVFKQSAFRTYISAAGNITSGIALPNGANLDFVPGNSDWVRIPDHDDFSFTDGNDTPFTITGWVNFDDSTTRAVLAKSTGVGDKREWMFTTLATDKLELRCIKFDDAAVFIGQQTTAALTDYENTWIHIAATYDGSETAAGIKLYINGSPVAMTDTSAGAYTGMTNRAGLVEIGSINGGGSQFMDGGLAEIKVYSDNLSDAQILANFYRVYQPTNLVAYWKIDEGAGLPQDSSGNGHHTTQNLADWDTDFLRWGVEVTATGVSSGEHTITTTANITHLLIAVDNVTQDTVALTANVTNNSENWTFVSGGSMPYMEYHKIWIDGVLQQHIEWEYNAVEFTDLSGNSHNVDPTFRTTSSNANVSAEVSQQEGLITGSTPSSNVSGGWTMITSALETPENLFSEGGDAYAVGEFNIGELVTDYAAGAGHPPEPYHFLLAFGIALIVILGVYGFTHNSRMGRQGSLSLAFFAGGLVLIAFYRFETIPGWTLIPYGLGAILLIMWRRTPSPVD